MLSKIRIISLGNNQANWVANLYKGIKKVDNRFVFDADNYYQLNQAASSDNHPFDKLYQFRKTYTLKKYWHKYFYFLFSKTFWNAYRFVKSVGSTKQISNFVSVFFSGFASSKEVLEKIPYDIYHFHFIKFSYLFNLYFLPRDKKVICTYWGSDLLRSDHVIDYYFQQKALNRADIITVQNEELTEIILAKFGRHLKPKIKQALFLLDNNLIHQLNEYRNKLELTEFKSSFLGITDPTKKIVMIGHNANRFNNHLLIIEQLKTLNQQLKNNTVFVFLMTYGQKDKLNYAEEISMSCKNAELNHRIISDYLSTEDLAKLKLCVDVFVHLPESDAMSGTLIEAAYAGNKIITGSWLPYKKFKQVGISYQEIEHFNQLPSVLVQELENPITNHIIEQNKKSIKNTFSEEVVIKNWLKIYYSLV